MKKVTLLLAIRSLNIGGAERQFLELVKYIDKNKFDVYVCTMYGGLLEKDIEKVPDVHYRHLHKKGRYDLFSFFIQYRSYLASLKPDVIYSFLPEMNLFSLWCKPKKTKIIWGFRASNLKLSHYGYITQLIFWFQKYFSKKADYIIANSEASILFHQEEGFYMKKSSVIYNGIDTNRFIPSQKKRTAFRMINEIPLDKVVVGIVGRIDIIKGHTLFAKVANSFLDKDKRFYFVAVGSGDEHIKESCKRILGVDNRTRFLWLDSVGAIEDIYPGLDIFCSTSLSESFSNVIAEAMSCEIPCIVTDVGDSRLIVGDCGLVIPTNNEIALYGAIMNMSTMDKAPIMQKGRKRIENTFSIATMIAKTENLLLEVINNEPR